MSVRRLAAEQPEGFAFTPQNLEWAKAEIKKYPEGRQASAVLSLLWRAQEQMGDWIPEPALRYVSDMLGMAYIRVYEIVTFYTMFNLAPVGRHYVQVCGTTPCMLRGSEDIMAACRKHIGPKDTVSGDGMFSWTEVECLGACVNAPMAQINKYYYEDLTPENFEWILNNLRAGRDVEPGPQNGRQTSAPLGGPNTLTDPSLYAKDQSGPEPGCAGAALLDERAKLPGAAANVREAAVPKPPLAKGRKPRPS
ncbi:MAG: NADH-quinone oxidoreductase subunit NuoE [Methyloceanibacter sp.]|uniref:NADH-quinone oxidoreductase subunit NuoE n=1 Tax=Methyloceanibacter sp. TaxID=1965321 RepID=UPI003D6C7108